MDCGLLLTAVGGGRGAELGGLGGVRQAGGADDQRHAVGWSALSKGGLSLLEGSARVLQM